MDFEIHTERVHEHNSTELSISVIYLMRGALTRGACTMFMYVLNHTLVTTSLRSRTVDGFH